MHISPENPSDNHRKPHKQSPENNKNIQKSNQRSKTMPVQKHRWKLNINEDGYESATRGSPMFPCSAYWWDLTNSMCDEIPWHWHEEIEVLTVKSGALRLCINNKHYILNKGDGAFINSNIVHSIRTAENEISTLNSLVFNADILEGAAESVFAQKYVRPLLRCRELPFIPFRADYKNEQTQTNNEQTQTNNDWTHTHNDWTQTNNDWTQTAARNISDAYKAYDEEKYGYELIIREKLSQMLYLIVMNNRQTINQKHKNEDKDTIRLKTMISYLHKNYPESIKLHQIAGAANVSQRECLRCFKKTIGISPIQYLLKLRVSVAAKLLTDTDSTMTEICDKTGFDNPSHFSRVFKSFMAKTPSEYRKGKSIL